MTARETPKHSALSRNELDRGVSKNRDTPKWMVIIMEIPIKIDDLGGETPIGSHIFHLHPAAMKPAAMSLPFGWKQRHRRGSQIGSLKLAGNGEV